MRHFQSTLTTSQTKQTIWYCHVDIKIKVNMLVVSLLPLMSISDFLLIQGSTSHYYLHTFSTRTWFQFRLKWKSFQWLILPILNRSDLNLLNIFLFFIKILWHCNICIKTFMFVLRWISTCTYHIWLYQFFSLNSIWPAKENKTLFCIYFYI